MVEPANEKPEIKVEVYDFGPLPGKEEITRWVLDLREKAKAMYQKDSEVIPVALFLATSQEDSAQGVSGFIDLTGHVKDEELDETLKPILQKLGTFLLVQIHMAWTLDTENLDPDSIYDEHGSIKNHPNSQFGLNILESTGFGTTLHTFYRQENGELVCVPPIHPTHGRLVDWLSPTTL